MLNNLTSFHQHHYHYKSLQPTFGVFTEIFLQVPVYVLLQMLQHISASLMSILVPSPSFFHGINCDWMRLLWCVCLSTLAVQTFCSCTAGTDRQTDGSPTDIRTFLPPIPIKQQSLFWNFDNNWWAFFLSFLLLSLSLPLNIPFQCVMFE